MGADLCCDRWHLVRSGILRLLREARLQPKRASIRNAANTTAYVLNRCMIEQTFGIYDLFDRGNAVLCFSAGSLNLNNFADMFA